ncbi:MAG: hypothetical protein MRY60_06770 [Algiphilus sp.]|uniref:hypothetical protein n=1 Tax=Algiphilus sp. TaxID=1872431 RepID=UPI001CA697B7|nr:hypothetical protein [Algiphilus sp.]MCI5103469.1 hypothetical protein [Algiphilus sp.]
MAAEQPAASAYTIHADADGTSQLAVSSVLARAGLSVAWQRPPEADCLIAHAGWLEPSVPAHLCMAGSAALRWLRESADPTALLAEASQRGMRVVLAKATDAEALRIWLDGSPVALGVLPDAHSDADILHRLRMHLLEARAPLASVYGVLAEVFGLGVLIVGPAGVGKSELALELLARGHRLVADDVAEIRALPGGLLEGRAPHLLRDYLEVRGLGVLDVARMYGRDALVASRRVDFRLELLPVRDAPTDYRARLAGLRGSIDILGQALPTICLPVRVGHNLGTLVEAACRDQWLRLQGHFAEEAFAERQQRAIDEQTGPQ